MRAYKIKDPEILMDMMYDLKDPQAEKLCRSFIGVWRVTKLTDPARAKKIHAVLELSRNAMLYKVVHGKKTLIGAMNLNEARKYAENLQEEPQS